MPFTLRDVRDVKFPPLEAYNTIMTLVKKAHMWCFFRGKKYTSLLPTFLKKNFLNFISCVSVCWYERMYVHYMVVFSETRRGHRIFGSRITSVCKPSHGCWELNLSPLKKQKEDLTTEPPLQPCFFELGLEKY